MVKILLVTHCHLANAFKETVKHIIPSKANSIYTISPRELNDIASLEETIINTYNKINVDNNGVLILTDICGATHDNIVNKIKSYNLNISSVSGLNLPMLLKTLNYSYLSLEEVTEKAIQAVNDCLNYNICKENKKCK